MHTEMLVSMLRMAVVFPGALASLLPMCRHLRLPARLLFPLCTGLLLVWSILGGAVCCWQQWDVKVLLLPALMLFGLFYCRVLDIQLLRVADVYLSVCGLMACMGNLSNAVVLLLGEWLPRPALSEALCHNALCWLAVAVIWHPATHAVRDLLDEPVDAPTWRIFFPLSLFFAVSSFCLPSGEGILYISLCFGYIGFLAMMLALFYYTARELGRNARLQRENDLLQIQISQYETLRSAIAETRQARHDLRHHFNTLSAMAQKGAWTELRAYLDHARESIPSSDLSYCANPAVDGVSSYYAALSRREGIPFDCRLELPGQLPVAEMDVCLLLSNLLENALEASRHVEPDQQHIRVYAAVRAESLLFVWVENSYTGTILEQKDGVRSSKHAGAGLGLQSVRRIAEKNKGHCGFTYEGGLFRAEIMMCGDARSSFFSRSERCEKGL